MIKDLENLFDHLLFSNLRMLATLIYQGLTWVRTYPDSDFVGEVGIKLPLMNLKTPKFLIKYLKSL